MSRRADVTDFHRANEQNSLRVSGERKHLNVSFETPCESSTRTFTKNDNSFDSFEEFSSRKAHTATTFEDRRSAASDGAHRTTSRSNRSPDRRSRDRSLEHRSRDRGNDRGNENTTFENYSFNRSFDAYNEPTSHGLKTVERNEQIMHETAKKVAYQKHGARVDSTHSRRIRSEITFEVNQPGIQTLSNEGMNKIQSSNKSIGMTSLNQSSLSSRDMFNKSQDQMKMDGMLSLEMTHITDRLISLTFPSEGHDTMYSFGLKEIIRKLKAKYGDNFLILNLSESQQDLSKAYSQVKEFGWPNSHAPPLERLCSLCKTMDQWLSTDIRNVIILHCKGGCRRVASVVAAYMHYSNICASADQARDCLAMKRFYEDRLADQTLPSQQRYVAYFSGLLAGSIKINSNPVYLHHILIHGVPNFDTKGGCRPYIKIYQSMQAIFTSGVYNVTDNMQKVCISITPGIPLRGDILIKCYHKKTKSGQREVIWQCQFHTCAVSDNSLVFTKQELDDAVLDPRFPDTGKVEFVFGPSSDVLVPVSGFKSDVTVPVDDNEETLVRTDSYENFNRGLETVDGYPGHNQSFNTHLTLSTSTSNNNVNGDSSSQAYTSQNHQVDQRNIAGSKRGVQRVEEYTQLDELLNNLLNDQLNIHPAQQTQSKSHQAFAQSQQSQLYSGGTSSITRAETMEHEMKRGQQGQGHQFTGSYQYPYQPSYESKTDSTSSSYPYRPKYESQTETTLPSYPRSPNYESKTETSSSSYPYSSLDGETNSWLAQQQQKLKNFKEGRDSSGRTEQERNLVNELQFAQNKYYTISSQSEAEEKAASDSYSRQTMHNGPTSPPRITSSHTVPGRSKGFSSTDGRWSQEQFNNSSYMSSSYVESHNYENKKSHKPPPSPTGQRSQQPVTAPVPVPVRSSSREYMRARSNSGSSSWQHHHQPLQRQHSETLYAADPMPSRSCGSAHSTPPHSPPRAISPTGPRGTTMFRQRETYEDTHRAKTVPTQVKHSYVTEVFVHRNDPTIHLDELEKSLDTALQSTSTSQQHMIRHLPPHQSYDDSRMTHSSKQYKTYQESVSNEEFVSSYRTETSISQTRSQSPPIWDNVSKHETPRVKEIEEDRIMLRPIGPGMQTLEPETAHTGTLGRPTTPGFPTTPSGGGQQFGYAGTQQQQQTQQYQQYVSQQQQQQYTMNGQSHNTLHIDTSSRMTNPSANSPTSPGSFNTLRQQLSSASPGIMVSHSATGQSSPSVYFGLSRRGSLSSLTESDAVHATPKFVKDTSKFWYKPNISREEAIQMLKDKPPGSFVIRDSNSFPGAFGLALKVPTLPPNVQAKPSGDPLADLVRHFLIEPTAKGVRLRGCSNEPVFGSLAALVYQHSVTSLALPWKLTLPQSDAGDYPCISESSVSATDVSSASTLLAQGAACNVVFINSVDLESLTGPQAIAKAVKMTFDNLTQIQTTVVHFKVFDQGITLTDNNRKLFFRRHYPVTAVTYCGMDPQDRRWKREMDIPGGHGDAKIFGFVARKQGSQNENSCHIFAELDPEQPASAIVNFVTKVMIGQSKIKS